MRTQPRSFADSVFFEEFSTIFRTGVTASLKYGRSGRVLFYSCHSWIKRISLCLCVFVVKEELQRSTVYSASRR